MKERENRTINFQALLLSIVSSFAFVVNVGTVKLSDYMKENVDSFFARKMWQISNMFSTEKYETIFFVILLFVLYRLLIPKINKKKSNIVETTVFSVFFATCITLASSYHKLSSWDGVFGSSTALLSAFLKISGYAVMCFFVINLIYSLSFEADYSKSLTKKKLFVIGIIVLVCWVPYILSVSPGGANPDIRDQLAQITGNRDLCWTARYLGIEGDVLYNNHHPIFHTMYLKAFYQLGTLIGSQYVSFTILIVLQAIALDFALCYLLYKLDIYGANKKFLKILTVIIALCPMFPLWAAGLFKDVPFSIILIVSSIIMYDVFKNPRNISIKKCVILSVLLLLLTLFRNNGLYIFIVFIPFVFIHFIKNKQALIKLIPTILLPILIYSIVISGILFSNLGIAQGSKREMLSVPFQQTARYVSENIDEVTQEEEAAILKIFKFEKLDELVNAYNPSLGDPVKNNFNENSTSEDLKNYIKVWASQFAKHPTSYIEAVLNLDYAWISTESSHKLTYYNGITDNNIYKINETFRQPEALDGLRWTVQMLEQTLEKIPGINLFFTMSAYTWGYIVLIIVGIKRKKYDELLTMVPILLNFAICFIGPVGYMRYAIPMVFILPLFIYVIFKKEKTNGQDSCIDSVL